MLRLFVNRFDLWPCRCCVSVISPCLWAVWTRWILLLKHFTTRCVEVNYFVWIFDLFVLDSRVVVIEHAVTNCSLWKPFLILGSFKPPPLSDNPPFFHLDALWRPYLEPSTGDRVVCDGVSPSRGRTWLRRTSERRVFRTWIVYFTKELYKELLIILKITIK